MAASHPLADAPVCQPMFLPGDGTLDVTVSIVNYNVRDHLKKCLDSIRNCGTPLRLQVVVVDNSSTDGSVDMVHRDFPEVRLIALPDNIGYAAGNNRALQDAQGRYILILNPDTEVTPAAIDAIVSHLQTHPEAGLVGCRLLNSDGSLQHSILSYPRLGNIFAGLFKLDHTLFHGIPAFQSYRDDMDYDRIQSVETLLGACLMIPRETFRAVGPLDERFFLYAEETDLCFRIRNLGKEIHYIPFGTIVHHREKSTASRGDLWRLIARLKGSYLFFEKHRSRIQTYLLRCLLRTYITLRKLAYGFRLTGGSLEGRSRAISQLNEMTRWLKARGT